MFGLSLLLLLALYSVEAMAQGITILGWSSDKRYFAVRAVEKIAIDEEREANQEGELQDLGPDAGLVGFCPEYIDPISKRPFRGSLEITVYQILSSVGEQVKIQLDSKPLVIYGAGALPEVFGTLTKLRLLYINKSKLTGLSAFFGELSSLEPLYTYRNQLSVFTEVLTNRPNLR